MIAKQLDLFGPPLKPPVKIKEDDELPPVHDNVVEEALVQPVSEEAKSVEVLMPSAFDPVSSIVEVGYANGAENLGEFPEDDLAETSDASDTLPEAMVPEHAIPVEELPELEEEGIAEVEDEIVGTEMVPVPEANSENDSLAILKESDEDASINEDASGDEDTSGGGDVQSVKEEISIPEVLDAPEPGSTDTELEEQHNDIMAGETVSDQSPLSIPADADLFKRQYYTMRETAAMFHVNQSLLRFWENEFDVLKPKKNKKGDRYFRPVDIKNLELIYHLLRVRKFTIDGAREYLKNPVTALNTFDLVQRLEKLRLFLQELKTHL